jgi:hypothetical protein
MALSDRLSAYTTWWWHFIFLHTLSRLHTARLFEFFAILERLIDNLTLHSDGEEVTRLLLAVIPDDAGHMLS